MTAFAKAEKSENGLTVSVEIRSYNSRHLDFNIRVPHGYTVIEDKIKELVSNTVSRGRVEIRLYIKDESDTACAYEVNEQKAGAYADALRQLSVMCSTEGEIPLSLLATAHGIITPAEVEVDIDTHWGVMEQCVSAALVDYDQMRLAEGDFIRNDFSGRLDYIETAIGKIEKESDGLLPVYRKRLTDRIKKLTDGIAEIDEGRIAQESALLAERSDISEEIVRAHSHVKQFRAIMDAEEAGGRKLNFLLQEFNREFNTMGSKVGNAEIAHLIVDVKSELEKLREQVQNVE